MNRKLTSSLETIRPRPAHPARATSAPPQLRLTLPLLSRPPLPLPCNLSSESLPTSLIDWSSSRTTPSPSHPFPGTPLSWLRMLTPTMFQQTIVGRLYQLPQHLVFEAPSTDSNSSSSSHSNLLGQCLNSQVPARSRPAFSPVRFQPSLLPTLSPAFRPLIPAPQPSAPTSSYAAPRKAIPTPLSQRIYTNCVPSGTCKSGTTSLGLPTQCFLPHTPLLCRGNARMDSHGPTRLRPQRPRRLQTSPRSDPRRRPA